MPDEFVNVRYMVDDVQTAVAFYTTHFGFALRSRRPGVRRRRPRRPAAAAERPRQLGRATDARRAHTRARRLEPHPPIVERPRRRSRALRAAGLTVPQRHRHRPGRPADPARDPAGNPIELFQPAGAWASGPAAQDDAVLPDDARHACASSPRRRPRRPGRARPARGGGRCGRDDGEGEHRDRLQPVAAKPGRAVDDRRVRRAVGREEPGARGDRPAPWTSRNAPLPSSARRTTSGSRARGGPRSRRRGRGPGTRRRPPGRRWGASRSRLDAAPCP